MSCPFAPPRWWQEYSLGRLVTPQAIFAAAWNENPDPASAEERFFAFMDGIIESDGWTAPETLKAPLHFRTESYQRQVRRANWKHCDPRLIVWAALFQEMARRRDIPLFVHSALRGEAEQNALVAKGNSKARYPTSAHNIGEACDVVHGTLAWQMNKQEWSMLHALGLLALDRLNAGLKKDNKLSLTWGGSWSFYDPAHWEISDFRARTAGFTDPVEYTPKSALAARSTLLAGL